MTFWELLSLTAGAAWLLPALAVGRQWGSLGILIGLLLGSLVGASSFWGTNKAGHWLIDRFQLDHPGPFRLALAWLLVLGAFGWIAVSAGLATTLTGKLFTTYLPAPARAPWDLAISEGISHIARHPVLAFVAALLFCITVFILWYTMFDRLLRIQFSEACSEWERQGCMSGYFWAPPGARETSMRERGNLLWDWLIDPPSWLSRRASFWRLLGILTMIAMVPAIVLLLWTFVLLISYLTR